MLTRRLFISAATAAAGAIALPTAAALGAGPKPARMTPSEALAELMDGNARYVSGRSKHFGSSPHREELAAGQHPFAMVLSCSDSRVPPEIVFDQSPGDLFVVRIAGNFAEDDGIGSLEYALSHFGSALLLVLGHSSCGAVHATVDTLKAGKTFASVPGNIADIVKALTPAAASVLHQPGDVYANATAANVRANVAKLRSQGTILAPAARNGTLRVAGGVYDLKSGRVTLL